MRRWNSFQGNSKQVFETTALVTKGKHKNLYLGSVKWGYQTDAEGNPELLPVTKASDGTPTGAFQEAAELWNGSQSTKGEDVVRLPIVADVLRLREGKDLMTASEGGRRRTNLPKGARVQPTGESTDGMVKVIVLDGSDTHTYQDGWITKGNLKRES